MAVEVIADNEDSIIYADAIGFRTEEEYNNLEVSDAHGRIIAAYAGGKWVAAIMVTEEGN
ncbi:hypothetical protein [Nocardia arthritidis]|uniref:Uncharacterized protein n=1 Tax=Nocardia arthritidis TaxID=228602 RepID=A0A6G9YT44_9NOCA|nr:hypothetical protein [Nocardia arthritidis]QIS16495.1 hypothetical protein F5544_43455 [Nocardia arthritidis]